MTLSDQCQKILFENSVRLPLNHPLGSRLVSLEYSKSVEEVKTYPLHSSNHAFFLCWHFSKDSQLSATMYPAPEKHYYQSDFQATATTQLHTHAYIELGYVVKGSFKQKIANRDVVFQEGDFCLIDKNCVHHDYLQNQDAIIIFFGIPNDILEETLDENVTTQRIISFIQTALSEQTTLQQFIHFCPVPGTKEIMDGYISSLIAELYENKIGAQFISKGYLLRIFHLLSTNYEFLLTQKQNTEKSWILFEEVCDYIKTHYQDIKIEDLATAFHFQKDYFNRLIKKNAGITYSEYVQSIRLNEAKKLLLSTDLNISEIAEQIGYHNKGHFYKLFTQKYGMTPADYRKAN